MSRLAIVVSDGLQAQEHCLIRLLEFFGIPWHQLSPDALHSVIPAEAYSVFSGMDLLGRMLRTRSDFSRTPLLKNACSLYLYGGGDTGNASRLLQQVTGCPSARVAKVENDGSHFVVAKGHSDVCGAMGGLAVPSVGGGRTVVMQVSDPAFEIQALISKGTDHVFCKTNLDGLLCFLDPCPGMIDISNELEKKFFDVRDYFAASVPIVMFLRSAFPEVAWSFAEKGACVVMDDAVLRPSYGYFDFAEVARLGREYDFTCSIGFIPWNWRRSNPAVVDLMKRDSAVFSLCIHGCDHSRGEFAADSISRLDTQTKLGISRMERHQELTGLKHERVMVFPQGLFSAEAPGVLKRNGFLAAINTDVSPVNGTRTEIGELWQTAITKYSDFPIFTRRYPFHGLWNFAFDLLLGKPCFVATHHNDFDHNCRDLIDFVLKIHALDDSPTWGPVGKVIRRAFSKRLRPDGGLDVKMFGNEIVIENPTDRPQRVVITKSEHDPEQLERFEVAGQTVDYVRQEGSIRTECEIKPRSMVTAAVQFRPMCTDALGTATLADKLRLAARRYLSEFRDEALVRAPRATALAVRTRSRLLHRSTRTPS
jgi:hypothetical protein